MKQKAALIFLVLNKNRQIIEANNYALELIGNDILNKSINEIALDFSKTIDFESMINDESKRHLINIISEKGLPQTFYFTFIHFNSETIAIGEINSSEIEDLRMSLVSMNNELSNLTRELHKKNAELIKLNDLKNQFLGMAAHDLRNPIGIVLNYSEYLLDETAESLNEEQIEFLDTIKTTSRFMVNLLNDLLDISSIESGKLTLDMAQTDISKFITTNCILNQVLAIKKNIKIKTEIQPSLPLIMLDENKMVQVLNNLITNAVKFSLPNTEILVKANKSEDKLVISVSDQGQGIPQNEIKNLFKPFERTSVRSTAGEKSTGLGLTITRRIIEGHKGTINVESTVGQGTTFSITIPYI
jgi:signal transduction histidine kinase